MLKIKQQIKEILTEVAESQHCSTYRVTADNDALKGNGFLSESYTGTVQSDDRSIHVYIKVPPLRAYHFIKDAFGNEYHFYATIFPTLNAFQANTEKPFEKIPRFFCGNVSDDDRPNYLALENLQKQQFALYDKTRFMDAAHLRLVFRTYGKYHALTFAFKDQHREKYWEIVRPLKPIFTHIFEDLHELIKAGWMLGRNSLAKIDDTKAKRIDRLLIDMDQTCREGFTYKGNHSALVHGDCWSNNMMFKYDSSGGPENLRMLDHQVGGDSTPVHDLSYFFYAAAAKEDLDKLDEYLENYLETFREFSRELGSDPDRLLPPETFRADWRQYSMFGINLALAIWQLKLMPKEEASKYVDGKDRREVFGDNLRILLAEGRYENIVKDLLLHAIDYNII